MNAGTGMNGATPPTTPWVVEHMALRIELDPERILVHDEARVVRTGDPLGPLELDGVGLETLAVEVDGQPAGSDQYEISDDGRRLRIELGEAAVHTVAITTASRPERPGRPGITFDGRLFASCCEPEGFRRITWSLDRPAVRSTFDVTLIADPSVAPVLLAAGELIDQGTLSDGRQLARYLDPVAKPTYLFAAAAGHLASRAATHRTITGREIELVVTTPPELIDGADVALATLDEMMRFDEAATAVEHDLDRLTFVAVPGYSDATEYQGLMFFNPSLLVIDPEGWTDDDLMLVLLNVAHEYGHHARGNRVTVTTWQQLPLKEGLTVLTAQNDFRRHVLGPAARILEVHDLRRLQHPEEVFIGAPVLRAPVADPTQLYTRTTYLKGAEIFAMMRQVLGPDRWDSTLRGFLARHDRGAATVADFVALARGEEPDAIDGIARWFGLTGRPDVEVRIEQSGASSSVIELTRRDSLGDDPAVTIPLRLGFLGDDGSPVSVTLGPSTPAAEHLVLLSDRTSRIEVGHPQPFVLAPSRGWSAPIDLEVEVPDEHLAVLARHDADPTTRWWAAEELMIRAVDADRGGESEATDRLIDDLLAPLLRDACAEPDPLLLGQLLAVPDEQALGDRDEIIDVDGVAAGLTTLRRRLGAQLLDPLLDLLERSRSAETGGTTGADIARRSVLEPALALLLAGGSPDAVAAARVELASNVPTRSLRAVTQLLHLDDERLGTTAQELENEWRARWGHVPGLVERGIRARSGSRRADTIARVAEIVASPWYDRSDRQRVIAVWLPLATRNRSVFHAPSGEGYRLLVDELALLLGTDAGAALRLVGDLLQFRRFDERRQQLMRSELERLAAAPGLPDFAAGVLAGLLGG